MCSRLANDIELAAFQELLKQYPDHIPPKLEDLETFRMQELPTTLQERVKLKQVVHLTKTELVKLVEWKLKHGTFRPKLLSLVQSNSDAEIQSATSSAFKAHLSKPDAYQNANAVTSLKGIGIATGSLILSTLDSERAPFFGDEVFRWIMWDEPMTGSSNTGKGWDRRIAYNAKEYRRFVELVDVVRERLAVPAIEIEQVGYVLGRLRANLSSSRTTTNTTITATTAAAYSSKEQKRKAGSAVGSAAGDSETATKRKKTEPVAQPNTSVEVSSRTRSGALKTKDK